MSDFQHFIRAGGGNTLPVTNAVGAVAGGVGSQGFIATAAGDLAVNNAAVIDHFNQGLSFDVDGRLAVAIVGVIDHFSPGGFPMDSAGRLVVEEAAVVRVDQHHPFTAAGRIAITVVP